MPPAEAMACGLPVIVSSAAAGVSEIITDGVDGLILSDPKDATALSAMIRRLYEDEAIRTRLGERAAVTTQKYTWERNGQELAAILEGCSAQKSAARGGNARRENYERTRHLPKVMSAYSPKEYWTGVADEFRSADAAGLAPVLHFGAPTWFNRLIDKLQFRAVRRALAMAEIPRGALVFDVGCGTGRWLRRYKELGFQATGVDATPGMLGRAIECGTTAPLIAGEACYLPFADATFDCVSDITVVQHIPRSLQPQALREMMRVLKPGGRLILMELIRGEDAHIFPRSPQDWIQQVALFGGKPIGWFGQEYLLLDRFFVYMAQKLTAT